MAGSAEGAGPGLVDTTPEPAVAAARRAPVESFSAAPRSILLVPGLPTKFFVDAPRVSRFVPPMRVFLIVAIACLSAASAAAHPPHECRTTLTQFAEHQKAVETNAAVAGPVLKRLSRVSDEATAAESHASRHAVIYSYFVANYPTLRPHLSVLAESAPAAIAAATRTVICLQREEEAAE